MRLFFLVLLFCFCSSCGYENTEIKKINQTNINQNIQNYYNNSDVAKINKDLTFSDRLYLLTNKFGKDRIYNNDQIDGEYFQKVADLIYSDDMIIITNPKSFGIIPEDLPNLLYIKTKLEKLLRVVNSDSSNLFFEESTANAFLAYSCLIEALDSVEIPRAKNCRNKMLENITISDGLINDFQDNKFSSQISKFNDCTICELAKEKKVCNAFYFNENLLTLENQKSEDILNRFFDKVNLNLNGLIEIKFYTDYTFIKDTKYKELVKNRVKIIENLIFQKLQKLKPKQEIEIEINQKKLLKSEKNHFFKDSIVFCFKYNN